MSLDVSSPRPSLPREFGGLHLVENPNPEELLMLQATEEALGRARRAQLGWAQTPLRRRLEVVRELRHLLAEGWRELASAVELPQRRSRAETLAAEILPLADACRFLEREAPKLLAPKRLGRRRRPFWLAGSEVEIARRPLGVVLVIGPANYPLFLPGVQALQALAAGNAVLVKPGRGAAKAARRLGRFLAEAGLPDGLFEVLDEAPEAARAAIAAGVDKVVLTGSSETGRAVAAQLAEGPTPAVMELSGCDPVFVRAGADLEMVARALRFGLAWNGSFTCIAPRRVYVERALAPELEKRLVAELEAVPEVELPPTVADEVRRLVVDALGRGARLAAGELPVGQTLRPLVLTGVAPGSKILDADLAAPVVSLVAVEGDARALELARESRYELGTTVFGEGADGISTAAFAERVPAGVVVVDDLIVPTADPRVPFGGHRASGHGTTRGAEGLLEMTAPKTVIHRSGRFRPHFDPPGAEEENLLAAFLGLAHGRRFGERLRALADAVKAMIRSRGGNPNSEERHVRTELEIEES